MVAQCTTPAATMHHSTDDDAPSSAVKLHFLSGVRISSSKKLRKAQETQSYQRFQHTGHTDFNTSGTNASHSLPLTKVDTHSALLKGSHTGVHRAKQGGHFGWGWYHYPRTVSHVSETLRGWVPERQTLPLLGLGWMRSPKNAESLRNSDALMRVAVPRRRGPAGLRDPW